MKHTSISPEHLATVHEMAGITFRDGLPVLGPRPGFTLLNNASRVNYADPEVLRAILPSGYTVSDADENGRVTVTSGGYSTRFSCWLNLWTALHKIANGIR